MAGVRPPYGPPAQRGDGRHMWRPYGLAYTYPNQGTKERLPYPLSL